MKSIKPKRKRTDPKPLLLRLDWRAYFKEFCVEHGEPMEIGGRLVFPDGWAYSSTDHKGPEWEPPPEPELTALLIDYWQARKDEAERQFRHLKVFVKDLQQLQAQKSCPLRHKVKHWDGTYRANGVANISFDSPAVDIDALVSRLEGLVSEVQTCTAMIGELDARQKTASR